ncbi:helix-turn-helix domain-containing protein [Aerosakkonemataceae cyanobacterium BLCC-F154]|uniref:Helix-turn-helix domain-containing protein n=1 Tax=Floridaenema fluviatile BLCC-F154 TaxID=3153640 RepID=A0ABV4YFW3_9CYAN
MGEANISGPRIKQAREILGWQQSDLAAALEVDFNIKLDQSDISEIERQKRGVKDFELDAISRLLRVSPVWLLRGEESSS